MSERVAYHGTRSRKEDAMFSARTKVIMAIACGVGVAAGALTYLASRSLPQALFAAGTATGSSADLLRQFIGTDPEPAVGDRDPTRMTTATASSRRRRLKDQRRQGWGLSAHFVSA